MGNKTALFSTAGSQYNGLVYSQIKKGGCCEDCILFVQALSSVSNLAGTMITHPLTNLQKASEKLHEHFTGLGSSSARKHHLAAVEKAENFKAVMEKKQVPVDHYLSTLQTQCITQDKEKLKCIA